MQSELSGGVAPLRGRPIAALRADLPILRAQSCKGTVCYDTISPYMGVVVGPPFRLSGIGTLRGLQGEQSASVG